MSQTSLPPLYKRTQSAFEAPFAYYKPGKAPASFARSANIAQLIADGQLGFYFIPLRESEDDRTTRPSLPSAQPLMLNGAIPLVTAYAIEGFEPSAGSNLSLERSGPFRVTSRDSGAEIAKGLYTYDELLRQHKVGDVVLPAGIKMFRYTYIYMGGKVFRLKMNSTLERGVELAVKLVYQQSGSHANRVYITQLCQPEHYWSLTQMSGKDGQPSFVQVTKEGARVQPSHAGDVYFMPHLEAKFVTDPDLIKEIDALREQIKTSFLLPRPLNQDTAPQVDEVNVAQSLPSLNDNPANDLPF